MCGAILFTLEAIENGRGAEEQRAGRSCGYRVAYLTLRPQGALKTDLYR